MEYKRLGPDDVAFLKGLIPPERLVLGDKINEDYHHDELGGVSVAPQALVFVLSIEEISAILAYANQRAIPVVVRGSGTGLVGGAVAVCGGLLLDTTKMDKILELDRENLTITVQPGVLLMTLAQFVEENGFLYPPDPGEKSATIGGNISTNAGGMRAVKYGVTRDYVQALKVVLPSGEVLSLGSKAVKSSSGYSLCDLIVGSEGTLAVVGEATLKLVALPRCSISLLVPFASIEEAIHIVPLIIASAMAPTAVEFMERETILFAEDYLGKRFPDSSSDAYVLLTFDGAPESVQAQYEECARFCLAAGALDAFLVDTDERKEAVWSARGAFLEAIKASTTEMDECDVVVPRNRVAQFIAYTREIGKALDIRIPSFGHAGDGNLHVYICRDALGEEEWQRKLKTAFDKMYAKAREYGGLVSGEHGIGYAKRKYLAQQCGPTQMALMQGIKQVFDPNGILNPQKVV